MVTRFNYNIKDNVFYYKTAYELGSTAQIHTVDRKLFVI